MKPEEDNLQDPVINGRIKYYNRPYIDSTRWCGPDSSGSE